MSVKIGASVVSPTCLSVFLGTLDGNAASGVCGLRHLEISQPDEEKISGAAQVAFCRGRNSKAAHQRWGIAST
jgi:hypothetical protein